MNFQLFSVCAISILLLTLPAVVAFGQSKNGNRETFYCLQYNPNFKLSNNWRLKGEIEIRRFAFPDRQHQLFVPRVTLIKRFPNAWDVGAGILYLWQSLPQDSDMDTQLTRPEIRTHQNLVMREK